jgi:ankyrin repeat protein
MSFQRGNNAVSELAELTKDENFSLTQFQRKLDIFNSHKGEIEWAINYDREATALHFFAENGHTRAVKLALEVGSDPAAKTRGKTPLFFACENGHRDIALMLLETGKSEPFVQSDWEGSAFEKALTEGDSVLIEAFISQTDKSHPSVLAQVSKFSKHVDIVKRLLSLNYDPNILDDSDKKSAVQSAAEHNALDCLKVLVEAGGSLKGALLSTFDRLVADMDLWKYLIEANVDIYETTEDKSNALHKCIHRSHYREEQVKLLISSQTPGRDLINAKDNLGRTPFFNACKGCSAEIVKALLDANADPFALDDNGCTPGDNAITFYQPNNEVVQLLFDTISAGSDHPM